MPTPLDPVKLQAALIDLGVTPAALHAIRTAHPSKGKMLVDELKLIAKSRYRKLALELHPDRNGGDSAKTARFSFLAQVIREVESMEYRTPPAPPPPVVMPVGVSRGVPQTQTVIRQVVFRAVPMATVVPASKPVPRSSSGGPATPNGIHVVFIRPV